MNRGMWSVLVGCVVASWMGTMGTANAGPGRLPTRFVALEFSRDADFTGRLVTGADEAGVAAARVSVLYRLPGNLYYLCETTTDATGGFTCRGSPTVGGVEARFLFSGSASFGAAATSVHWEL